MTLKIQNTDQTPHKIRYFSPKNKFCLTFDTVLHMTTKLSFIGSYYGHVVCFAKTNICPSIPTMSSISLTATKSFHL